MPKGEAAKKPAAKAKASDRQKASKQTPIKAGKFKRQQNKPPALNDPRRCTAHSSRTGEPCRRWAIKGGAVCATHGGSAPDVKARAAERIQMSADLGARRLIQFMNDRRVPYPVRLRAAESLLDRAGLGAAQMVQLSAGITFDQLVDEVALVRDLALPPGESEEDEGDAADADQSRPKRPALPPGPPSEEDDPAQLFGNSYRTKATRLDQVPLVDGPSARGSDTPPRRTREAMADDGRSSRYGGDWA